MKTIQFSLTLLLGAALGALGLHSCGSNATPNVPICTSYASDPFGEDAKVFAEAVERYKRTHGSVVQPDMNSKGVPGKPTQVSSLSFETLKMFLYYLEHYSTEAGISTADLEIPIYYAIHDSLTTLREYRGLHTVYIGVARRSDKGLLVPIDPRAIAQNHDKSIEAGDLTNIINNAYNGGGITQFFGVSSTNPINPTYMRNQWHLCPPNCPPQSALQQMLEQITVFVDNDIARGRAPIDYLR